MCNGRFMCTGRPTLPQLRILTVGDGDFSCSLALLRAYPSLIHHLVATSLLSRDKVLDTYPNSFEIVNKLSSSFNNASIVYNVDATALHTNEELNRYQFDLVMFHHPHLGYDTDDDDIQESDLTERHASMLAQYMHSASQLLKMNDNASIQSKNGILPCIHLCVCAGVIDKWKIYQTAQRLGLEFAWDSPTAASSPPFAFYEGILKTSQKEPSANNDQSRQIDQAGQSSNNGNLTKCNIQKRLKECQRAKRRGHYLGRFGYRHQPTHPDRTEFSNVSNSFHLFLTRGIV
jgi:hypothetical protein